MRFRSRSIHHDDLIGCGELLSARPPYAGRETAAALADTLAVVLRVPAVTSRLVDSPDLPPGRRIVTFGLNAFVERDYLDEYLKRPFPHLGAHIIRHLAEGGDGIVLNEREIAARNASTGLDAVTIALGWAPERVPGDQINGYLQRSIEAFHDTLDGYRMAALISECFTGPECDIFVAAGAWRIRSTYGAPHLDSSVGAPVLIGITRDEAIQMAHSATATADLFVWREPRLAFTPDQQQLLLLALDHQHDRELGRVMGLQPDALRRRWNRIFKRVERRQDPADPILAPGADASGKRTRLLMRLSREMHELRPRPHPRVTDVDDDDGADPFTLVRVPAKPV